MLAVIYKAENAKTGKCYIGFTSGTLSNRRTEHHRNAFRNNVKTKFYDALRSYGKTAFSWSVIFYSWDKEYCHSTAEPELIVTYDSIDNGYNILPGGNVCALPGERNGMYGRTHTKESRKKISEATLQRNYGGERNPFYRKQHTQNALEKMRKPRLNTFNIKQAAQRRESVKYYEILDDLWNIVIANLSEFATMNNFYVENARKQIKKTGRYKKWIFREVDKHQYINKENYK